MGVKILIEKYFFRNMTLNLSKKMYTKIARHEINILIQIRSSSKLYLIRPILDQIPPFIFPV